MDQDDRGLPRETRGNPVTDLQTLIGILTASGIDYTVNGRDQVDISWTAGPSIVIRPDPDLPLPAFPRNGLVKLYFDGNGKLLVVIPFPPV